MRIVIVFIFLKVREYIKGWDVSMTNKTDGGYGNMGNIIMYHFLLTLPVKTRKDYEIFLKEKDEKTYKEFQEYLKEIE